MARNLASISLLILCLSIRYLYAVYQPLPILTADSYGYQSLGQQMLEDFSLFKIINQYRTPLYPLFLQVAPIIQTQIFLGLISVLFCYLLAKKLNFSPLVSWLFALFIGFNPNLFSWERALLSETLATTLLLGLTYVAVLFLQKPQFKYLIWIVILGTLGWLTRPALLLTPVLILLVSMFSRFSKPVILTALIIFLSGPLIFNNLNFRLHNYRGISQVADIDLLGKILEYNLPVEAGKNISFYYQAIKDYRFNRGNPMPFRFLETYDPEIYQKVDGINELRVFNRQVIAASLPAYLWKSITYLPYVFTDLCEFIEIDKTSRRPWAGFFYRLQEIYRWLWITAGIALLPATFILLIKPTRMMLMLWLIVISIILPTVLVVYHDHYQEYGRLVSLIQPQVYLLLLLLMRPKNNHV